MLLPQFEKGVQCSFVIAIIEEIKYKHETLYIV